jgi:hypothetical protein
MRHGRLHHWLIFYWSERLLHHVLPTISTGSWLKHFQESSHRYSFETMYVCVLHYFALCIVGTEDLLLKYGLFDVLLCCIAQVWENIEYLVNEKGTFKNHLILVS